MGYFESRPREKFVAPLSSTLDAIEPGQRVIVSSVSSTNHRLHTKLLAMGIVAGTMVEVLRVAPLGDPIKIRALGYKLSLRTAEARSVNVTPYSLERESHDSLERENGASLAYS